MLQLSVWRIATPFALGGVHLISQCNNAVIQVGVLLAAIFAVALIGIF